MVFERECGPHRDAASSILVVQPVERGLRASRFLKRHRLRKSSQFRQAYRKGRKIITPVIIFFVCATEADDARLGLTVSKKNGCAVRRNRIKRMIRESFRLTRHHLSPMHIVAIPRRGAFEQPLDRYIGSFEILARKLKKGARKQS